MNFYDKQRARRHLAARFDRDERERRRLESIPPATSSPEILPATPAEIAEAEARRIAALPWWERLSPEEQAERDAIRARSRYLSC